jgi:hypothetical protein
MSKLVGLDHREDRRQWNAAFGPRLRQLPSIARHEADGVSNKRAEQTNMSARLRRYEPHVRPAFFLPSIRGRPCEN